MINAVRSRCSWWKLRCETRVGSFTARIYCKGIRIAYLWNLNPSATIKVWNYWREIWNVRRNIYISWCVLTVTGNIPIHINYLKDATNRFKNQLRDIGIGSLTIFISKSWIRVSCKRKARCTVCADMVKIPWFRKICDDFLSFFSVEHLEATDKWCLAWFTEQQVLNIKIQFNSWVLLEGNRQETAVIFSALILWRMPGKSDWLVRLSTDGITFPLSVEI